LNKQEKRRIRRQRRKNQKIGTKLQQGKFFFFKTRKQKGNEEAMKKNMKNDNMRKHLLSRGDVLSCCSPLLVVQNEAPRPQSFVWH
jgi:hypothetical protein